MRALSVLGPFFLKYRGRFAGGIIFILLSNYFAVLSPQLTGLVIDLVQRQLPGSVQKNPTYTDPLILSLTNWLEHLSLPFTSLVAMCGVVLLILALLRGLFMFFMRQTLIVMSRLIEYDQKNEIYRQYQQLEPEFYKTHQTGDLMNRISEDVSRVRMFTGPAVMYLINLLVLISLTVYYMFRKNTELSLIVLAPLPLLALAIYFVNRLIHKKSERVQELLSGLTVDAQQAYSGIRVIKSFVQESFLMQGFQNRSEAYRRSATDLNKTEAIYFPSMALVIGVSTLLVIYAGGNAYVRGEILFGDMAAFIMYLTMLMFPVSAIGWVASTIQRAAASQERINEFLHIKPSIKSDKGIRHPIKGEINFSEVRLTYPHSGVTAVDHFSLRLREGQKVAIIGKTGSGKSSLLQLLLRFYDPNSGHIELDGIPLKHLDLLHYRNQIGLVPQESFLFSDTIRQNILFGNPEASEKEVLEAAEAAAILGDIQSFEKGFETIVGERGVTLSGGQKQRLALARALVSRPRLLLLDDSLSAVDYQTERRILEGLEKYASGLTTLVITNRIFSVMKFDLIVVLDNGVISQTGKHDELLRQEGLYRQLYERRTLAE
jgi:ATP-binding cassette subfamily B protein